MTELESAVLYALRCGCFHPVPKPDIRTGSTQEWIKWGAMVHLHDVMRDSFRLREKL